MGLPYIMWLLYVRLLSSIKARRIAEAHRQQQLEKIIAKGGPDWQYLKRRIIVAALRGKRSCTFPSWWDNGRKEWAACYARRVKGISVYYDMYADTPISLSW